MRRLLLFLLLVASGVRAAYVDFGFALVNNGQTAATQVDVHWRVWLGGNIWCDYWYSRDNWRGSFSLPPGKHAFEDISSVPPSGYDVWTGFTRSQDLGNNYVPCSYQLDVYQNGVHTGLAYGNSGMFPGMGNGSYGYTILCEVEVIPGATFALPEKGDPSPEFGRNFSLNTSTPDQPPNGEEKFFSVPPVSPGAAAWGHTMSFYDASTPPVFPGGPYGSWQYDTAQNAGQTPYDPAQPTTQAYYWEGGPSWNDCGVNTVNNYYSTANSLPAQWQSSSMANGASSGAGAAMDAANGNAQLVVDELKVIDGRLVRLSNAENNGLINVHIDPSQLSLIGGGGAGGSPVVNVAAPIVNVAGSTTSVGVAVTVTNDFSAMWFIFDSVGIPADTNELISIDDYTSGVRVVFDSQTNAIGETFAAIGDHVSESNRLGHVVDFVLPLLNVVNSMAGSPGQISLGSVSGLPGDASITFQTPIEFNDLETALHVMFGIFWAVWLVWELFGSFFHVVA